MAGHARYTALLDACVLHPMAMADALMSLASAGLYAAKWSRTIEAEWIASIEERRAEIADARRRYEGLLAKYPQAFADHAAEFYLGAGANAERAWALAQDNLAQHPTRRAHLLAIRAAHATHRTIEANKLKTGMRERFLATAA
jgi:hypothetical protein